MDTPPKLFIVIQMPQIKAWCWGSCGHGGTSALYMKDTVGVPCRFSPCPHLEKEEAEPLGKARGEWVYLRKLELLDGHIHEETP